MVRVLLVSIFCISLFGCEDNRQKSEDIETANIKRDTTVRLIDKKYKISNLYGFEYISEGNYLIADNRPSIYIAENNIIKKKIGNFGQDPCSYESITSMERNGQETYVLDRKGAKVLKYTNNREDCSVLNTSGDLIRMTGIEVVSDSIYLVQGSPSRASSSKSSLLYVLRENDESYEIVSKSDIYYNTVSDELYKFPVSKSGAIDGRENILFFNIVPTGYIFKYNVKTGETHHVNLGLERIDTGSSLNIESAVDKIKNTEIVMSIFANDRLYVSTKMDSKKSGKWRLYVLDNEMNIEMVHSCDNHILSARNRKLYLKKLDTKRKNYPYTIEIYDIQ